MAPMAAGDPLAVSISEAARITSLSERTIYNLIYAGKLRSKKVGRRRLIDAKSLREFIGMNDPC